jgi:WD40 repeat protein
VTALACSSDGRTLVSGGGDWTIWVWDVQVGRVQHVMSEHTKEVSALAFHPAGGTLASACYNGAIKVWDVASGTCLQTLRRARLYEGMDITGATGLNEVQRETLKALGAVEA